MKDIRFVPTLSLDGWVGSTQEAADYLFSHFFLSEVSQTECYPTYVTSFPELIERNNGDMSKTRSDTEAALRFYFSNYFYDVETECTIEDVTPGSSNTAIRIFVEFKDANGNTFNLARLGTIENSKIVQIVDLNNTGKQPINIEP